MIFGNAKPSKLPKKEPKEPKKVLPSVELEALKFTIEMASNAYKNDEGIVGVPTGLKDLDDRLGGLHKSDLIIIAGRPSMGKTALATNIAFNAATKLQESGKKSSIAFFSLEMSSEQLSTRILAEGRHKKRPCRNPPHPHTPQPLQ